MVLDWRYVGFLEEVPTECRIRHTEYSTQISPGLQLLDLQLLDLQLLDLQLLDLQAKIDLRG